MAEWLENRGKLREERLRWTGILTSLAFIGIILVPVLSEYSAKAEARSRAARKLAMTRESALLTLQEQLSAIQPRIDSEATLKACQRRSRVFMGEILGILNATSPRMAVELVDGSVVGGELTLRAKAQAEDYQGAQDYVALAGRGSRVKSSILTTARPNMSISKDGVTFEFAKKIEVED